MTSNRNTQPIGPDPDAETDDLLRRLLQQTDVPSVQKPVAEDVAETPPPVASASTRNTPAPVQRQAQAGPRPSQPATIPTRQMNGRGTPPPPPPLPHTSNDGSADEAGMTLVDHLREVRSRLMRASIGVVLGMLVGLFLVMGPLQLVDYIITSFAPTNDLYPPVQAVGTAEAFTSFMTVALTVGVILGMPVIVYQLLAFVVPGLTRTEKGAIFKALPFVIGFFALGILFGWFITVPTAIHFLIGFSDSTLIQVQPTLSDFIRMVTLLLLINGVVFELPIIIYVLALLGVVTAAQLRSYRRYAFVIVFIVAAIITPTGDPVNLALLALPMYALFELGILLASFVSGRTPRSG